MSDSERGKVFTDSPLAVRVGASFDAMQRKIDAQAVELESLKAERGALIAWLEHRIAYHQQLADTAEGRKHIARAQQSDATAATYGEVLAKLRAPLATGTGGQE